MSVREKIEKEEFMKPIKSLTTDHERQVYSLIQRLNTIRNEKVFSFFPINDLNYIKKSFILSLTFFFFFEC